MFLAKATFEYCNVIADVFGFERMNSSPPCLASIDAFVEHRNEAHIKGCTIHVEIKKMSSLIGQCIILSSSLPPICANFAASV